MSEPTKPMSIEQINQAIELATDFLGPMTAGDFNNKWRPQDNAALFVARRCRDTLLAAKSTIASEDTRDKTIAEPCAECGARREFHPNGTCGQYFTAIQMCENLRTYHREYAAKSQKTIAELREKLEEATKNRCETCGSKCYSGPPDCPTCGAPNCCQSCCTIDTLRTKLATAEATIAKLRNATRAYLRVDDSRNANASQRASYKSDLRAILDSTESAARSAQAPATEPGPGAEASPVCANCGRTRNDHNSPSTCPQFTTVSQLAEIQKRTASVPPGPVDDKCPECGRKKAHSVGDVLNGLCPKWWAIRDEAADNDCKNYIKASDQSRQATAGVPNWVTQKNKHVFIQCADDDHRHCSKETYVDICTCPCHAIPTITGSADAMKTPGPAPMVPDHASLAATIAELVTKVSALEKGKADKPHCPGCSPREKNNPGATHHNGTIEHPEVT